MDIKWFKEKLEPHLTAYAVEYGFFLNGDFGDLDQVRFDSKDRGGEIDFWSSGSMGAFVVDYSNGNVLLNVFFNPQQVREKSAALSEIQKILVPT
jgi:hypothetical protein